MKDVYPVTVDIYMVAYRILKLLEEEYNFNLSSKKQIKIVQDIKDLLIGENQIKNEVKLYESSS